VTAAPDKDEPDNGEPVAKSNEEAYSASTGWQPSHGHMEKMMGVKVQTSAKFQYA